MSHFGTFVVLRPGAARIVADRWAGLYAAAWFARGPGYAADMASDCAEVSRLEPGEAGFLIDFETRTGLLYDLYVGWSGAPGEASQVLEPRRPAFSELDLYDSERDPVARALEAGRASGEAFFEALRTTPASENAWTGWTLRWVTGTFDFRAWLDERGHPAASSVISAAEQQRARADTRARFAQLSAIPLAEKRALFETNARRRDAGLPPISLEEWIAGRRD